MVRKRFDITRQNYCSQNSTVVISKIFHKAFYLPMHFPEAFIKQLDKLMFKFILGSKWEKISTSKLCCNIEDGGAKRIEVKQSFLVLKFRWIGKLFNKRPFGILENH